jgi:hypothetical protein
MEPEKVLRMVSAPATMWNLHTTQPNYFAPIYGEVVNLSDLL